jgi:hypothetical protein
VKFASNGIPRVLIILSIRRPLRPPTKRLGNIRAPPTSPRIRLPPQKRILPRLFSLQLAKMSVNRAAEGYCSKKLKALGPHIFLSLRRCGNPEAPLPINQNPGAIFVSLNTVDLKHRLCDIETDGCDRLHDWLLRIVGAITAPTSVALMCRWRSRPQHQTRTGRLSRGKAVAAHDLNHFCKVRRTPGRRVDHLSRLAEILRTYRGGRDYAKHLHILASVIIKSVNGAARNA